MFSLASFLIAPVSSMRSTLPSGPLRRISRAR